MNMKTLILGAGIAAVAMLTGCMSMPVHFVDKSVPVEEGKYSVIGDEVEGSDSQVAIFGLGLNAPGSAQRRAYKQALANAAGADGLVEMAVDMQFVYLPIVTFYTTRVTGTPIKINK